MEEQMRNEEPDFSSPSDSAPVPETTPLPFLVQLYDVVQGLAVALTVVLVLFLFFLRSSVVDGYSMMDTLHDHDRLLVWDFCYSPSRGDVVILQSPVTLYGNSNIVPAGKNLVKRVVAVAGDTVEICADGNILVNGELVEGFFDGPRYLSPSSLTVPEGTVFLAGDHRNNSFDSRYFGPVDVRFIQGRAFFRIAPLDAFGIIP